MLRLASDADVHGDVVRALRRRRPDIDLIRVQDEIPAGTLDPDVLAWAAEQNRVLITNDRNTMIGLLASGSRPVSSCPVSSPRLVSSRSV